MRSSIGYLDASVTECLVFEMPLALFVAKLSDERLRKEMQSL